LRRRSDPPYHRPSLKDLTSHLRAMSDAELGGNYTISDTAWFSGGVSKIQMGFTLEWRDADNSARREKLVIRMDPAESHNATSRLREWQLLRFFQGKIPVPETFWLDAEGKWFPEPAIIYSFVPGVTKPTGTRTGQVSGLGTNFGAALREKLAP